MCAGRGCAAESSMSEFESDRGGRKRKISAGSPPPAEEEVIGPMPVAPENAAKKRKKGEGPSCSNGSKNCLHTVPRNRN